MKYALSLVASGAVLAAAQQGLGSCAQNCFNNMIGIALNQFHCNIGDVACYCSHPDFGYGVRDCSNQACSATEAAEAIGFANAYCAAAVSTASNSVASILSTVSGSGSNYASATSAGAAAASSGLGVLGGGASGSQSSGAQSTGSQSSGAQQSSGSTSSAITTSSLV
ncbi:hypothetical protein KCU75_g23783, partial [Aureobasidium melanogenum]